MIVAGGFGIACFEPGLGRHDNWGLIGSGGKPPFSMIISLIPNYMLIALLYYTAWQ